MPLNSTKYNEVNIIFLLEDKAMAQTQYKLKTSRSREDFQLFQVILLKYDPEDIKDIRLYLSPQQHIRAQESFGTIIHKEDMSASQQVQENSTQPISIHLSGKVDCLCDHFQKIENADTTFYHLKQPQKKGNLSLMYLRECDHIPRDETFLNCSSPGQSTKKNRYPNAVSICNLCQTPLWKYYDQQQVSISLAELCTLNSISNISSMLNQFSWSIVLNEQFTKTTEVGKMGDQEISLPYLAKASFLLDFDEHRKKIRENTVVIKIRKVICKHEKIIEDRCQFCMEQIKQEHLSHLTSYLFQNETNSGNVLMSGHALKHHEDTFIGNLLSSHKAMIILDLDNTILHSNEISELDLNTVLALKDFYLIPKIECQMQEQKGKRDLIVVKMRPFFKHFIYVVTKLYEIYVYTKGTRVYAQEICKYIRAQYAGEERSHPYLTWEPEKLLFLQNKKSFATNIISRDEDSNLQSKSFEKILPSKTEYHLILDDRRDVWNNSPAWFFTREYYYFLKKLKKTEEPPLPANEEASHDVSPELEAPEGKAELVEQFKQIKLQYPEKSILSVEINKNNDYFLLFAAYALRKIHKHFFEAVKAGKEEGEKEIVEQNQQKGRKINKINLSYQYAKTKYFFKQMKFQCFLGEDQNQNNNNTVRRAKKMGAIITNDSPDLVIRANDLMKQTKKPQLLIVSPSEEPKAAVSEQPNPDYYRQEKKELGDLFNQKIPVVSQSWIHYCYQFHYPFRWQEFRLSDPYQIEVSHENFNQIIEREAKAILKTFEDEMTQQMNGEHIKHQNHHIKLKKDKAEPSKENQQNSEGPKNFDS